MPQVLVTDTYLTDIGDAIRYKNGSQETYTPSEMAPAIRAITGIPTGYIQPSGTLQITSNGTYDVTQYAAAQVTFTPPTVAAGHVVEDANGIVIFSAESGLVAQTKTVTPNSTTQVITPDSGYDTLTSVTVNPVPNTYVPASQVITYYVDSADPTSSDGDDGDIWLVTTSSSGS